MTATSVARGSTGKTRTPEHDCGVREFWPRLGLLTCKGNRACSCVGVTRGRPWDATTPLHGAPAHRRIPRPPPADARVLRIGAPGRIQARGKRQLVWCTESSSCVGIDSPPGRSPRSCLYLPPRCHSGCVGKAWEDSGIWSPNHQYKGTNGPVRARSCTWIPRNSPVSFVLDTASMVTWPARAVEQGGSSHMLLWMTTAGSPTSR